MLSRKRIFTSTWSLPRDLHPSGHRRVIDGPGTVLPLDNECLMNVALDVHEVTPAPGLNPCLIGCQMDRRSTS